jgi:NADH:ubiquinone reductase (H+-translocating)
MVRVRETGGEPIVLPGVAPVAMQQGRYAAGVVRARLQGREHGAFRYRDKGIPQEVPEVLRATGGCRGLESAASASRQI